MGVYVAKAAAFGLAYYAKKNGHDHHALMRFKVTESISIIALEAAFVTFLM